MLKIFTNLYEYILNKNIIKCHNNISILIQSLMEKCIYYVCSLFLNYIQFTYSICTNIVLWICEYEFKCKFNY